MLAWLQKGQNRTRTGDGPGEDDTGRQTDANVNLASDEQPASSNVSAFANTDVASDSPVALSGKLKAQ